MEEWIEYKYSSTIVLISSVMIMVRIHAERICTYDMPKLMVEQ